jgi:hypothetical protein
MSISLTKTLINLHGAKNMKTLPRDCGFQLRVEDMEGEHIALVQIDYEVDALNQEYDQDYSYYFREFTGECSGYLYGSYSPRLDAKIYYVGEF